ncbi:MAG TPA: 50S ribosomal protein L24 [Clostridiales bacterium]|nr:50S ribosomal protein L24 [Clostridiales bacterium]
MAKRNIIKDDYVMIIAGKDKGKTAQVVSVNHKTNRVFIEGQGLATQTTKAVKAQRATDVGGLVKRPGSVDVSNVMPICSACNNPTRVGHTEVDGKHVRVCKKCGEVLVTKKSAARTVKKATKAKAAVRKKTAKKTEDK